MTEASAQALSILRDPGLFNWSVVTLMALVAYAYANEIGKKNWSVVLMGLILPAGDMTWEMINALVLHFSNHAPLWCTPGRTSFLILVGINVEILFMFLLMGMVFVKLFPGDKSTKILGVPNRVFIPVAAGLFCIAVELTLNRMGYLVWQNKYWGNWPHTWTLFVNYLVPFFAITWGHFHLSDYTKGMILIIILAVDTAMWMVFVNLLGWI
ncbi:MAG: hypothetical protein JRI97_08115 [Deltaproteobacteria bacterium]|nr:hypothetical protein [Deltaproteobacteria bacterium]